MDSTAQPGAASAQWADRFEIKSETSSRIYVIARRVGGKDDGTWACTCPGFKGHKKVDPFTGRVTCKHLDKMGLPGPFPSGNCGHKPSAADTRRAFSDEAYEHYDPAVEGFGSADDWFRRAEESARGRGYYRGRAGERTDTGTGGRRRQQEQRAGGQRWTSPPPPPPPPRNGQAADLRQLGLDVMPEHVEALKRAMRQKAMRMHPNYNPHLDTHEGRVAFTAMFDAYERLLNFY